MSSNPGGLFSFAIDRGELALVSCVPLCLYTIIAYTQSQEKLSFFHSSKYTNKRGYGFGKLGILTNPKMPALETNLAEPNFSFSTKQIFQFFPFSYILKIDFSRRLCYNIYIGDNYIINYLTLNLTRRNYKMAANRLKLDFSIQTTNGRRDFVNEYVT